MDIIYNAMFFLLKSVKSAFDAIGLHGGYALAIIGLTAGLRLLLWPLNTAQTRSMKKTQELQPKIKALQDRYKDNPQEMQRQMMKFYAEHKFNPLAGCLPMIIQLPIFIGLYGMLISPAFLAVAGHESFLFVKSLSSTLFSHAGDLGDARFNVTEDDKFSTGKKVQLTFETGTQNEYRIRDVHKVLDITPKPLIPGDAMQVRLNPRELGDDGFSESFIRKIKSAKVVLVNDATKELEPLTLTPVAPSETSATSDNPDPQGASWALAGNIGTQKGENTVHWGVLGLIGLYALVTALYQRVMQTGTPQTGPQAQVMKLMPFLFVGFLIFIPIPAGVILYLVVTMLLMFAQTWWVQFTDKRDEAKSAIAGKPAQTVIDVKPQA